MNIEWTLIGSTLSLYWEPVVAMESESEVTGYQVSLTALSVLEWTFPARQFAHSCQPVRRHVYNVSSTMFFSPIQLSYNRRRHKEVNTLTTTNSTAELTLPEEEDNYIIHIQTLSEGGLGPASDPIRVHKLSKLAPAAVNVGVINRDFKE